MGLEIILSISAVIISLLSVYFAAKSAKHAKDAILSATIFDIHNTYNQQDMMAGIQYLFKLRNDNLEEFCKNPYSFAKKYVSIVDESSKEWYYRRVVLLFWSRIGILLKTGLLSEDLVFTLFPNVEVIEILEPIEVALADKYGGQGDLYIPLVYRKWEKWKKHAKLSKDMELPIHSLSIEKSKKI